MSFTSAGTSSSFSAALVESRKSGVSSRVPWARSARTPQAPPDAVSIATRLCDLRHWGTVAILVSVLTFCFESWDIAGRWQQVRERLSGNPQIVLAREPAETNLFS